MPDKTPAGEGLGTPRVLTVVIDRIEGTVAVLEDDQGGGITLPLDRLPAVSPSSEPSDGRRELRARCLPRLKRGGP